MLFTSNKTFLKIAGKRQNRYNARGARIIEIYTYMILHQFQ